MPALHALTRRDEGVLDSIALDEVPLYAVRTLNDVSVKSLHITHSTDSHSVLCIILRRVHCTREGSAKDLTSLRCPIVYPVGVSGNITVSTDEGELVWTVSTLELQGDIEVSYEQCTKRHDIKSIKKSSTCARVHTYMHVYVHTHTCVIPCSCSSLGATGRHWRLERANTTQSILSQILSPVYVRAIVRTKLT